MHGIFDLKDTQGDAVFASAFNAFCEHLKSKRYVVRYSFAKRAPHVGYDRVPPNTLYYVSIDFPDMTTANACYAYVAADKEPLRTLHREVYSRVVKESARFYLFEDI